jgi:voltage-dependent potassium channel beta subunit
MEYRRLGPAGVKVSVLSFGSWVTFGTQLQKDDAMALLQTARDAGVNFFDNAESYAGGQSEQIMGDAIAELGWARKSYLISTKVFWGIEDEDDVVNLSNTLNRKYLLQAIDGSLERLGLDFVDVLYCHRPDPDTPIEETVWAMSDIIDAGKALYWGTSEWSAAEIREAIDVAEHHHLRKPVVEQPQYNLFIRDRVEQEYVPLYDDPGLGLTIWSPLASGLLTGKYLDGVPDDSRLALEGYEWLREAIANESWLEKARRLKGVADELGCSLTHLALAWCVTNPRVSTVILGASKLGQLEENLEALDVVPLLDDDVQARLREIVA